MQMDLCRCREWAAIYSPLAQIAVLIEGAANAQNLNQGKSVAKLFADSCATCHRSARGLAKGRFSPTFFLSVLG
jgi:mono/diheme cytochrome c family protein